MVTGRALSGETLVLLQLSGTTALPIQLQEYTSPRLNNKTTPFRSYNDNVMKVTENKDVMGEKSLHTNLYHVLPASCTNVR